MQRSHGIAPPQGRPPAVYYHNGIGGRGNYHKYNHDKTSKNRRPVFPRSIAAVFRRSGSGSGIRGGTGAGGALRRTSSDKPLAVELDKPELPSQPNKPYGSSRWFNIMNCFSTRRASSQHPPPANSLSSTTLTSENRA